MTTIGIILVLVYSIGLVVLANRNRKTTAESSRSFFLGSGNGTLVILFSIVASGGSGWLFQGGPAAVYSNGVSYFALCVMWSMSYYVLYGYLAPRGHALGKYHNFVTLGEMYEKYYSSKLLAILIGIMQFAALVPSAIAQTRGMGLAMQLIAGNTIPLNACIIFAAVVVVLYCTAGGFGSLSKVDTVQGIMFTVIIWLGLIAMFIASGNSAQNIFDTIESNNFKAFIYPIEKGAGWAFLYAVTYSLAQTVGNMAQPILWQRFFAAKSGAHLKQMARYLAPVYGIIVLAATLFTGFLFNAFNLDGVSVDNAFQTVMGNITPIFGLIVGMGIIAAAMSTAAGALFTASSIATMNIIKVIKPDIDDKKLSKYGKLLIVVIAVFAVTQAIRTSTPLSNLAIIGISIYAGSALCLFGVLIWKRASKAGACAGVAAMLISAIYFYFINPNILGIFSGTWAFAVGALVFVIVSLCTKPVDPAHREEFLKPIESKKV